MKKKGIVISVTVIIALVMGTYFFTRPESLGNMNHSYTEPTTEISNISFSGKADDKIKFSFRSNIENGDLDMILYDSKGNAVYTLDRAKELETFFTLDSADTYTLAAECNDFVGTYTINVYNSN